MDNVAFSCLLAMANVAVSDCRDGLCRSGLWARCILTAIHFFRNLHYKFNFLKHYKFHILLFFIKINDYLCTISTI